MKSVQRTSIAVGALVILILAAVPVGGSPSLARGSHASYNWSVSVSFLQSCETTGTMSPSLIACPLSITVPAENSVNGTIGWSVTDVNDTTAVLNVTSALGSLAQGLNSPTVRISHSFNESINLATRIVSLLPMIEPEMDQVLQSAQTSIMSTMPNVNLSSSLASFPGAVSSRPFYTMWWVNGPLQLNQTIPVLLFPTNVSSSSTVDLGGGIGNRAAWTLQTIFPHIMPVADPATTATAIPASDNFDLSLTFNYDKSSDLLLSSNATIQMGFGEDMTAPQTICDPSTSCPMPSGTTMIFRQFGFTIQASLTLSNTNIDLSQRLPTTKAPQDQNTGSTSSSGSNTGTGNPGSNSGSGANTGTNTIGGSNYGNSGSSPSTGRPAGNAQQSTAMFPGTWPLWIYALIGVAVATIVAIGVLTRRRSKITTQTTD